MTYTTSEPTGGAPESQPTLARPAIRKLTESQGARSGAYEVSDETGNVRSRTIVTNRRGRRPQGEPPAPADIAQHEHIRQLLREADEAAAEVWLSDDPRDRALAGGRVSNALQDLWNHRSVREVEWGEAVNLLQIVLAGLEFERLTTEQRRAVARVFDEQFLVRTVGRSEMERILRLLGDAGFDIWRGLTEKDLDPDAR